MAIDNMRKFANVTAPAVVSALNPAPRTKLNASGEPPKHASQKRPAKKAKLKSDPGANPITEPGWYAGDQPAHCSSLPKKNKNKNRVWTRKSVPVERPPKKNGKNTNYIRRLRPKNFREEPSRETTP
jgi:hypothetical protein